MRDLDPRVQLLWLGAVVSGALLGGAPGIALAATAALAAASAARATGGVLAASRAVLPFALVVAALDALAGRPAAGAETGARLVALALAAAAFARFADGARLVEGLRSLRVPYAVTFALVTGASLVPRAAEDLADVSDAARLRGLRTDGSVLERISAWRTLLVPLLVSTIRRGLRLGEAMEARAFGVGRRTSRVRLRWTRRDTLGAVAAGAYLALALGLRGALAR